jgi:DNA-directed RNA polymerase subunit F
MMDITIEEDVSMYDARDMLNDRKNEKDLNYEQKICLEYLEKVCNISPAKIKEMIIELSKISILKPRYIALIINMMPDTEEEVDTLFSKERTNLKKDEIKQIVGVINKFKKS